jgi:hypothetical protein
MQVHRIQIKTGWNRSYIGGNCVWKRNSSTGLETWEKDIQETYKEMGDKELDFWW